MPKQAVVTANAPKARSVFSQAIVANGFVFVSGQIPQDLEGNLIEGTMQDRTRQCIKNLGAVLDAAGSSLEDVVEVNIFLANMDDFSKVNEAYGEFFGDIKPARTCVAVKTLPRSVDVEMKCTGLVKGT